jgi:hypothetical protein
MEKEIEEKKTGRKAKQQQLQFVGVTGPREFTRAGTLTPPSHLLLRIIIFIKLY